MSELYHNVFLSVWVMQFKAVEFRTLTKGEPLAQMLHCLYIYPQSVNLSKKRNLFIRVELRKDDSDIRKPPLEVFIICFLLLYIDLWELCSIFQNTLGLKELISRSAEIHKSF
jgi:hypothetical protein